MEVPHTETSDASESVDELLIDHLRKAGGCTVSELTERLGVTATAVRQRLNRLMSEGLVEKSLSRHAASDHSARESKARELKARELKGAERQGRGRPSHQYRLTPKASRLSGDNFSDLAEALWAEVMSLPDSETQHALVRRLAARLAARMTEHASAQHASAQGESLTERMRAVSRMMRERDIPFSVDESGRLPVLMAHACPYPELAEKDRSVCTLEKAMISELLGEGVELSECKLDGGAYCSFEPNDG